MNAPLLARATLVVAVAFLLLIPIHLIQGKIAERRARADAVVAQFAQESSGPQAVAGPLLAFTCEEVYANSEGAFDCGTLYLAPRVLRVKGTLPVEIRWRGIYRIPTYRAELDIEAEYDWPAAAARNGINRRTWKRALLVTAVRDPRGIRGVEPAGTLLREAAADGPEAAFAIRADLGAWSDRKAGERIAVRTKLHLTGTTRFDVAPVGDASEIRLASSWPHPSFTGAWLPEEREIGRAGFTAAWRTSYLATGGPSRWEKQARAGKLVADPAALAGLALFDPVNVYALSYRATEYAFLIVLFTFAAIALVEVLAGVRIHPVQYALVGSALAVFFLLLIALSEHVAFDHAYLAAATACLVLVVAYLRHPLGTRRRAATFGVLLAALYGALLMLLKSEDHALLLGSLMVFALLALAMLGTRKVDWHAISMRMRAAAPEGGVGRL